MFFSKWFKKKPLKPKNRFQNTIDIFDRLRNHHDFKSLYSSDYKLISIVSMYKNIFDYNTALKASIDCFKNNKALDKSRVNSEKYFINIHEFLLDSNRKYIQLNTHLVDFCDNSIEFLNLYNEKEIESNQSAEISRTIYLSQFILNNLIEIAKGFEDV